MRHERVTMNRLASVLNVIFISLYNALIIFLFGSYSGSNFYVYSSVDKSIEERAVH